MGELELGLELKLNLQKENLKPKLKLNLLKVNLKPMRKKVKLKKVRKVPKLLRKVKLTKKPKLNPLPNLQLANSQARLNLHQDQPKLLPKNLLLPQNLNLLQLLKKRKTIKVVVWSCNFFIMKISVLCIQIRSKQSTFFK